VGFLSLLKVWLVHRFGGHVLADHDTHRYTVEVAGTEYYADDITISSPTESGALIHDYKPDRQKRP
jgi:hypothetical protein